MAAYSKPSIGRRERITHRLIHYLYKGTSPKHPEWRDATIEFMYDLLSLAEKHRWINILIHRADGFRIYCGSSQIVFLHIRQKHILAHTNRDYLLWEHGDKLFKNRHDGSYDRMWRVTDRKDLKSLVSYIEKLPAPKDVVSKDKSRTVPVWVQEFVLERDARQCVSCGAKESLCFDHIIPYSRGGASDHPSNIQLLCSTCNSEKRDNLQAFRVN